MRKDISNDWQLELISQNSKIDITEEILKYTNNENILKINKDFKYENLIKKKNLFKNNYYLRIKKNKDHLWKTITINSKSPFSLNLGEINLQNPNIEIVYFLNADISSCYLKLLKDQLRDLIKSKILFNINTKLHCILICSSEEKITKIKRFLKILKLKNTVKHSLNFHQISIKSMRVLKKFSKLGKIKNKYIYFLYSWKRIKLFKQ